MESFDSKKFLQLNRNYQKVLRSIYRSTNDKLSDLFFSNDKISWELAKSYFNYFKFKIEKRASDNWIFDCIKYLKKYLHLDNDSYIPIPSNIEPSLPRAKNPSAHENYLFLANAELGIFINYLKDTFPEEQRNVQIFDTLLNRMNGQRSYIYYQLRNDSFGENLEAIFVNSVQKLEPFKLNPVLVRPDKIDKQAKFDQFRKKAVESSHSEFLVGKMKMGEIGSVKIRSTERFKTKITRNVDSIFFPLESDFLVVHIFENRYGTQMIKIYAIDETNPNQNCILPVPKQFLIKTIPYFKSLFTKNWLDSNIEKITSLKSIASTQTLQFYLESLKSGEMDIVDEIQVLKVYRLAEFLSDIETCEALKPKILMRPVGSGFARYPLLQEMVKIQQPDIKEYRSGARI